MLSRILNIIKITRPLNCIITFFSVLIGGFIISESKLNLNLLLFASISASFITAAGNVINDIYDVEADKISHPNRPLPLNKLSLLQAKIIYVCLNLVALIILFFSSFSLATIGIVVVILLLLYASSLKKVFLLGNLIVAFLTGLTFVFAGIAVGNTADSFIPAGFAFLINLIREIIKDTEDMDGDVKHKVNSLPIVLGIKKTRWIVSGLIAVLILFTAYPFFNNIYKIEYFILVMIIVNPILIIAGKLFFNSASEKNLKTASSLLKLNMIIGLVAIYIGK
jgi:geranylgeranylglycerol-phosphate geranylgeranyltransferase